MYVSSYPALIKYLNSQHQKQIKGKTNRKGVKKTPIRIVLVLYLICTGPECQGMGQWECGNMYCDMYIH